MSGSAAMPAGRYVCSIRLVAGLAESRLSSFLMASYRRLSSDTFWTLKPEYIFRAFCNTRAVTLGTFSASVARRANCRSLGANGIICTAGSMPWRIESAVLFSVVSPVRWPRACSEVSESFFGRWVNRS